MKQLRFDMKSLWCFFFIIIFLVSSPSGILWAQESDHSVYNAQDYENAFDAICADRDAIMNDVAADMGSDQFYSYLESSPNDATIHPNDATIAPNDATIHPNDATRSANNSALHPNDATISPNDATRHPNTTANKPIR